MIAKVCNFVYCYKKFNLFFMTFDYSVTKLKWVKCTNPDCMHVFKVYDKKEPVINDPGFVVKERPECHSKRIVGLY